MATDNENKKTTENFSSHDPSTIPTPRKPKTTPSQRKSETGRRLSKTLGTVAVSSLVTCSVAAISLRNFRLSVMTIALTAMLAASALVGYIYEESQDPRVKAILIALFTITILSLVGTAVWMAFHIGLFNPSAAWTAITAVVCAELLRYVNGKNRRLVMIFIAFEDCPSPIAA